MACCARGTTVLAAREPAWSSDTTNWTPQLNRAMLSQIHAGLSTEASAPSQLSFRISIASSTAAAKYFLIQAYFSLLSLPEGV